MELSGGGSLLGRAFPVIPQAEKNAIVKAALDGGISWFDTAEIYGGGVSEQSLAEGLRAAGKANGEAVVATKWFPLFRSARNIPRTIERRLGYLGGYGIDLYYVHQPIGFSPPEAEMDAMADLVAAGKIRSVGVSNFSARRMRRAFEALRRRGLPLAANQVHYSLLHREIETDGTLETARELGVTIVAYTPLASGLLSGKYHKRPELLRQKKGFWKARIQRDLESSRPLVSAMEELADPLLRPDCGCHPGRDQSLAGSRGGRRDEVQTVERGDGEARRAVAGLPIGAREGTHRRTSGVPGRSRAPRQAAGRRARGWGEPLANQRPPQASGNGRTSRDP
jgi:aryl-alcohol dehydrogenase-like predicted oxidoreductase